MLTAAFFYLCLSVVVAVALWRGRRDERLGALAVTGAALASPFVVDQRFTGRETWLLLIDLALFVVLGMIALRSNRFWPLWAAGFQLGALAVHVAAGQLRDLVPAAYAETLAIWSYAVLAALLVGSFEASRREADRS
ncbi:MAG: hypothetical protein NZM40_02765 [Sphingomonadaceae bacterium]|uniref:hypothetical protein n=1 Tax=Thermaurantiacus sp. TaxID=2820283 RepID=UPI00298F2C09|nr:hypothetical protein [Thermaurantiacus sp.]MCS6986347.1 hypothetical protein [Sphingomonadaceae bacterium]MDW8414391.1 hypothetical protein [Thermaurantiacus sp.]